MRPLNYDYFNTTNIVEGIVSIYEYPNTVKVVVAPIYKDTKAMVDGNVFDEFELVGYAYEDLMSDKPAWSPNKPANTYRNEDLWYFIDKMRAAGKDKYNKFIYTR